MPNSAYAGRHRKYAGRHRSAKRSLSTTKVVGTTLLVPTGAAATLILSGGSTLPDESGQSLASSVTASSSAQSADLFTASAVVNLMNTSTPSSTLATQAADELALATSKADTALAMRAAEQASRDEQRERSLALAEERERRAAILAEQEADAAKGEKIVALTKTANGAPGSKAWVKPISGYVFTSPYGYRWGRLHAGNDVAAPVGTPVRAMSGGTVVSAKWDGGYGLKVVIRYWDGSESWYAHLSSSKVATGDSVNAGEIVAKSGNTGHSTGPHLHMEIHPGGGEAINPMPWLRARGLNL